MKELLEYMLKNILEKDFTVSEEDENGFIVYKVTASQDEIGKIIGKGGKTINALKNILKIRAIKEDKKIDIQVVEA
jgi:predicted RNA-binding protein YlqC (UPF0109 family)